MNRLAKILVAVVLCVGAAAPAMANPWGHSGKCHPRSNYGQYSYRPSVYGYGTSGYNSLNSGYGYSTFRAPTYGYGYSTGYNYGYAPVYANPQSFGFGPYNR